MFIFFREKSSDKLTENCSDIRSNTSKKSPRSFSQKNKLKINQSEKKNTHTHTKKKTGIEPQQLISVVLRNMLGRMVLPSCMGRCRIRLPSTAASQQQHSSNVLSTSRLWVDVGSGGHTASHSLLFLHICCSIHGFDLWSRFMDSMHWIRFIHAIHGFDSMDSIRGFMCGEIFELLCG